MRRGTLSTSKEVPRTFGWSSMNFARPARGEGSAAGAGGVSSDEQASCWVALFSTFARKKRSFGIRTKRLRAGWDEQYPCQILRI